MDTREPVNPPIQGAEYPRILYRDGEGLGHVHIDEPMLVQGRHRVDTTLVYSLDEEMMALEEGWRTTADPMGDDKPLDARDAEIKRLREQLEASNRMEDAAPTGDVPRRRGRPPLNREVTYGDAA